MVDSIFTEDHIKRMLEYSECNETEDAWILKKSLLKGRTCKIKIDKNKIRDVLNRSKKIEFKNNSLYKTDFGSTTTTYFEQVVRIVYEHQSLKIKPLKSTTLELSIDSLSDEYSLFLYLSNSLPLDVNANLMWILSEEYADKTIDFWELIHILNEKISKIKSIKIKSIIPLTHKDINRLTKTYLFNCAYRLNAVISMNSIFKEYHSLFPNEYFYYTEETILKLNVNEELLDYYQRAIRLKDPFESFLSFYHIFEYFFNIIEEEFKENINLNVTNKFNGSEQEFKKIILADTLNEKKLLQLVFRRFIDKKMFKDELKSMKPEYYKYLKTHGVEFTSKTKDNTKLNDNDFYRTLTERIYTIRNALVHRKEGAKEPKYLPFKKEHKDELRKELLLMKVIANQIIIKSSK